MLQHRKTARRTAGERGWRPYGPDPTTPAPLNTVARAARPTGTRTLAALLLAVTLTACAAAPPPLLEKRPSDRRNIVAIAEARVSLAYSAFQRRRHRRRQPRACPALPRDGPDPLARRVPHLGVDGPLAG